MCTKSATFFFVAKVPLLVSRESNNKEHWALYEGIVRLKGGKIKNYNLDG